MKEIFSQKSKIETHRFVFKGKELQINILREDQLHPIISGNKLRKLKYPILGAVQQKVTGIISFGGAYSNHLSALSYCCSMFDLPLLCMVRSNDKNLSNPTLKFIESQGASIAFLSFAEYRMRNDAAFLAELQSNYPNYLIIKEGGKGGEAEQGVGEIVDSRVKEYDRLIVGVGTGTTFRGLKNSLGDGQKITGFSAVPQKFLDADIRNDKDLNFDFLFGAYAKTNVELQAFVFDFWEQTKVLLDPIYTSKAMYGLCSKMSEDVNYAQLPLLIHTGGLQGFLGMEDVFPWVKAALPQALVSKHL
ncbi:1-aminocyclopropane-1-carboxylate deaminase/D-cysteine desulfhydrase [Luteibaculum oceani]|uniref:Pyridoxal-phosphate dependent enzyme n=1 Tax=Luteibaculum oceani TaxID=1294296 RepID=A0A5C6UXY2_9FLAO|nr:pyridoxal-phosphate dependent enzyme [Luteibaculum oceani]TXC78343.1 pyridoxal-phosphate dependent enzyme [Luteibaculum oceani]